VIPAPFRSLRALRVLNVAAVGLSLAAVVAATLTIVMRATGFMAAITGIPTLVLGLVWAAVLRSPRTVGSSTFRWGWAASVPLAILNAALACGLMVGFEGSHSADHLERFLWGGFMGATVGALVWVPALAGTLLCFGAPIAWAQKLAHKGLAGEERGEWVVGLVCTAMSTLGILAATLNPASGAEKAQALILALSLGGMLTGGSAAGLAGAREARRRRFVAEAEDGKVAGYRVDETDEGKVLVRVVAQGKGYRVADFEEEVFELDAAGEATRPKTMEAEG
jgi:hypothetical protein